MWTYEKKLEYPVKIKTANPNMAKLIISQLGGPDGEMGAATRYLSQRYSAPWAQVKGTLTDIGTEELVHLGYQLFLYEKNAPVGIYPTGAFSISEYFPHCRVF